MTWLSGADWSGRPVIPRHPHHDSGAGGADWLICQGNNLELTYEYSIRTQRRQQRADPLERDLRADADPVHPGAGRISSLRVSRRTTSRTRPSDSSNYICSYSRRAWIPHRRADRIRKIMLSIIVAHSSPRWMRERARRARPISAGNWPFRSHQLRRSGHTVHMFDAMLADGVRNTNDYCATCARSWSAVRRSSQFPEQDALSVCARSFADDLNGATASRRRVTGAQSMRTRSPSVSERRRNYGLLDNGLTALQALHATPGHRFWRCRCRSWSTTVRMTSLAAAAEGGASRRDLDPNRENMCPARPGT